MASFLRIVVIDVGVHIQQFFIDVNIANTAREIGILDLEICGKTRKSSELERAGQIQKTVTEGKGISAPGSFGENLKIIAVRSILVKILQPTLN